MENNERLRPEVRAFATLIEGRLAKHDDDRGESWKAMNDLRMIAYLSQRVALLVTAIDQCDANPINENWNEVVKQAASVGAAAMFIADNFNGL